MLHVCCDCLGSPVVSMAASHTGFTGSNLTDSYFIFTCVLCILVFYIHAVTFYTVLITVQNYTVKYYTLSNTISFCTIST